MDEDLRGEDGRPRTKAMMDADKEKSKVKFKKPSWENTVHLVSTFPILCQFSCTTFFSFLTRALSGSTIWPRR